MNDDKLAACLGAPTIPERFSDGGAAEKCVRCGTVVARDLVDHPFFGFANSCESAPQNDQG